MLIGSEHASLNGLPLAIIYQTGNLLPIFIKFKAILILSNLLSAFFGKFAFFWTFIKYPLDNCCYHWKMFAWLMSD